MKNIFKTDLITSFIKEHNLSKTAFCKLCKISIGTLNKILANNDEIGIIALFKISRILNIKIYELFN